MKTNILLGIMLSFMLACSSSKSTQNKNAQNTLDSLIQSHRFEIKSNRARPTNTMALQQLDNAGLFLNGSNASNIDLSTNTNFLRMKNDTVTAFLPFFGERQFGGSYGKSTSIEFEGIPENLEIKPGKKGAYNIRFNISDKNAPTDNYNVFITLFPNLNSTININSTSRSSIQYIGYVEALDDKK